MEWHFEPAPDIDQSFIERLRSFPRQPDMLVYGVRSLTALMLRAWLKIYHRLRIEGRENLPMDGSFVLVANHCSHLDVACLLSALPLRKLHRAFPAAAKDYFFVNLRRTAFAAIFINALPFSRKGPIRHGLEVCQALLSNPGNILILFPEGTRSATGQLGAFRPGIGHLLAGTDLPVVPCALKGTFAALCKSAVWPRPRAISLVIGRPRRFADFPANKQSACAIAQQLQDAVQGLS